jgi:DNA adenine methylase
MARRMTRQLLLDGHAAEYARPRWPLLKWIGSKYRYAETIASHFPRDFRAYYEVFLGSGALLGTVAPGRGVGADSFAPLVEIWQTLQRNPETVKRWYADRWRLAMRGERVAGYEQIKQSYNASPNGADFLFLTRACYGGVVRFRKNDGYMSTPCGIHTPIHPESFAMRVDEWASRVRNSRFVLADYREVMAEAKAGDLVYCDPPYAHTQAIVYGAQGFDLGELFKAIARCKDRGVRIALSIDGTKRSGDLVCDVRLPEGLFAREIRIRCGRSMLRRFQMNGRTLEKEEVTDRLLLTY